MSAVGDGMASESVTVESTRRPRGPLDGREWKEMDGMAMETIYQHSLAATIREFAAKGLRRLLVTSSEPGEGKSTVAADVGRALARSGRESVLLVDADQYKP